MEALVSTAEHDVRAEGVLRDLQLQRQRRKQLVRLSLRHGVELRNPRAQKFRVQRHDAREAIAEADRAASAPFVFRGKVVRELANRGIEPDLPVTGGIRAGGAGILRGERERRERQDCPGEQDMTHTTSSTLGMHWNRAADRRWNTCRQSTDAWHVPHDTESARPAPKPTIRSVSLLYLANALTGCSLASRRLASARTAATPYTRSATITPAAITAAVVYARQISNSCL